MANGVKETIVVDANPLFSALRGGKARTVLYADYFVFITTEYTTWEVRKFLPEISSQTGVSESDLLYALEHFPIIAMHPAVYEEKRKQAETLIAHRDPKDVEVLSLALKLNVPVWTTDRDFENISEVQVFSTADMLSKLAELTK